MLGSLENGDDVSWRRRALTPKRGEDATLVVAFGNKGNRYWVSAFVQSFLG
jgi:hypothetical protein